MTVDQRQAIEKRIASALIRDGLAAGYAISVHNGEEESEKFTKRKSILAAMFSVDDEHLLFYKDGKKVGWVYLVYGNDGWDVICDYTMSLEGIMEGADKASNKAADLC